MRYSESAERALIAAVLSGSDLSAELLRDVQATDFFPERNKVIWSTAQEALASGVKPDIIQVRDRLETAGKLPSVDGVAYLMELCDEHISDSGLEGAAKIVRGHSIARSAAVAARKIGAMVEEGEESGEIVSMLLATAAELSAAAEGRRRKPESVFGVLDSILNNDEPEQLKTGFGFIDNYTRISAENFIIIGARPGAGKSSLALGIAISASRQGKRVLFNCLEMSTMEMTESLIAHETRIELSRIITRQLDSEEHAKCRIAAMVGANIVFSPQKTMPELLAKCRSMKANGGIDLVITDFIQKMTDPTAENRTQEVGRISRQHKELAQDFGIPVIALSQLSRAGEAEPTLKDLRESGDLEQDANAVYFIWRVDRDCDRGFKIAKDRRGAGTPAFNVGFDGRYVRFYDIPQNGD